MTLREQIGFRNIIGILSNTKQMHEYSHLQALTRYYIESGMGIICIYYGEDARESLYNHFEDTFKDGFQAMVKKGQIGFLSKQSYLVEDGSIRENFYRELICKIELMRRKSFKEFRILINTGKETDLIYKDDLCNIYDDIFEITKLYKAKVIMRFFIDEIERFDFINKIAGHGCFLVEDVNNKSFMCEDISHKPTPVTCPMLIARNKKLGNPPVKVSNYISVSEFNQVMDEVCHDFKNIFANVVGYSQLAMLKTESEEVKKYLDMIFSNCLNFSLDVERFKEGLDKRHGRSTYCLNNLIKKVSKMIYKTNGEKLNSNSNRVSISYSLKSVGNVFCNRHEMEQVIMNIVNNGIQAISGEGSIEIRTYDCRDTIIMEIIDNGRGIDEITLSKIFQPYFTTKKERGMGLGLYIVKKILNDHSATISVESKLGHGTKFTIVFPTIGGELAVDSS